MQSSNMWHQSNSAAEKESQEVKAAKYENLLAQGYVLKPVKRNHSGEIKINKIITAAEESIKEQAKRQLKTDHRLQDYLQQDQKFCVPVKCEKTDVQGITSLTTFQKVITSDEEVFELRSAGLSDEEIKLWMKVGSESDIVLTPTDQCTLDKVKEKLLRKKEELSKETSFTGKKGMTRHELELETALTHNNDTQTLTKMLFTSMNDSKYPNDHPMNHLSPILKEIESGAGVKLLSRREKKNQAKASKRQLEHDRLAMQLEGLSSRACIDCWRLQKTDRNMVGPLNKKESFKSHMCSNCKQNHGSSDSSTSDEEMSEEVVVDARLSIDEIKLLPRFQNYSPGEPCKVLYLKNLAPKVTEADLKIIFKKFDSVAVPNTYRLLTGKMHGQAFVTLRDEETAQEALKFINGFQFKGRPIIIQFGNKPSKII